MIMRIISLIVMLMLAISTLIVAKEEPIFITAQGTVILQGSEPLVSAVLITEKMSFTLTGELDFKKLQGLTIKVQGQKDNSFMPGTAGNIEVLRYQIISINLPTNSEWTVGVVKEFANQLYLLGENWMLYRLIDFDSQLKEKVLNNKVIIVGEKEIINEYLTYFIVDSFKVIEESSKEETIITKDLRIRWLRPNQ